MRVPRDGHTSVVQGEYIIHIGGSGDKVRPSFSEIISDIISDNLSNFEITAIWVHNLVYIGQLFCGTWTAGRARVNCGLSCGGPFSNVTLI